MTKKPRGLSDAIDELEATLEPSRLEAELRRVQDLLNRVRPQVDEMTEKFGDGAKRAKAKAESKIEEHPWATLGLVGVIFLVIGFLLGSSRRSRD